MKKISLLFAIVGFLFIFQTLNSQTLYFCTGVDKDGYPQGESQTFNIPSGGGYFYFLVRLPYEVQCSSVYYDLYDVYSDYSEAYNTTINQSDLGLDWVWFWKKVTFYKTGYYHVYVRDCYGSTLTSSYLQVNYK